MFRKNSKIVYLYLCNFCETGYKLQNVIRYKYKRGEKGDILKVIQKTKAEAGQSDGYSASGGAGQTGQASGTGAAGSAGGDSDDETTTTTKTVVVNGITYLETTTVENGVTSVQRTKISGVGEE